MGKKEQDEPRVESLESRIGRLEQCIENLKQEWERRLAAWASDETLYRRVKVLEHRADCLNDALCQHRANHAEDVAAFERPAEALHGFKVGDRVRHEIYGEGKVTWLYPESITPSCIRVGFSNDIYHRELALSPGLLTHLSPCPSEPGGKSTCPCEGCCPFDLPEDAVVTKCEMKHEGDNVTLVNKYEKPKDPCPTCGGSGLKYANVVRAASVAKCPTCQGEGEKVARIKVSRGKPNYAGLEDYPVHVDRNKTPIGVGDWAIPWPNYDGRARPVQLSALDLEQNAHKFILYRRKPQTCSEEAEK